MHPFPRLLTASVARLGTMVSGQIIINKTLPLFRNDKCPIRTLRCYLRDGYLPHVAFCAGMDSCASTQPRFRQHYPRRIRGGYWPPYVGGLTSHQTRDDCPRQTDLLGFVPFDMYGCQLRHPLLHLVTCLHSEAMAWSGYQPTAIDNGSITCSAKHDLLHKQRDGESPCLAVRPVLPTGVHSREMAGAGLTPSEECRCPVPVPGNLVKSNNGTGHSDGCLSSLTSMSEHI